MIRSCAKFRNILVSASTVATQAVLCKELHELILNMLCKISPVVLYCTLGRRSSGQQINVLICALISLQSAGVYCNLRVIWIYRSLEVDLKV